MPLTEDQAQRRAEFVADIRKENCLGAIDFRQRLGALTLLLVGARARNVRGNLRRGEIEEAVVLVVKPQPRTDSGDQKSYKLLWHA